MFQIFIELVGELVIGLGWESLAASFKDRPKTHPALAAFGYLLIGGILGAISAMVFPHRFSEHEWVSILGVFVNTAVFGLLMSVYGDWRRRSHRATTNLATFWGGAAFAFGLAAARLAVLLAP